MKFKNKIIAVSLMLLSLSAAGSAQNNYQAEIAEWRAARAANLQSENGWLSLAGLFWLKEGANSVGAEKGSDIELPLDSAANKAVGIIEFKNNAATLNVNPNSVVLADGKAVKSIELKSDDNQKPTLIEIGAISFTLIKRENRYGIRVRNKNSRARLDFKGLHWFPAADKYKVTASFEAYQTPKDVLVPNVLGGEYAMKSPGLLRFQIDGREYKLEPVDEDGKLFVIFRDLTSKTATYQAGRFLDADAPQNGKVILDFNKAYNPPCSFTPFATCPLPPQQNRLEVEIPAGEKRFHD